MSFCKNRSFDCIFTVMWLNKDAVTRAFHTSFFLFSQLMLRLAALTRYLNQSSLNPLSLEKLNQTFSFSYLTELRLSPYSANRQS